MRRGEWKLLAIIVGLFILRDLPWRLDEYDQAKQAFTSLEMVQAGHWGFQHTPGNRSVATKPPFIGWISAGLYGLTGGNWELAWRLPSLLAALVLVGLLWRAGEILWPGWGGTLAAGAFALNQLAPRIAALVRTDMPLTLWITLVGLIVWKHAGRGAAARPWSADPARPRSSFLEGDDATRRFVRGLSPDRWAVFFLLLAAMMTKGPVVYAFLLPGMAAHSLLMRHRAKKEPGSSAPPGIWGGWWHWTLPLVPFLFWLERGMVTVPGFYQQVVLREFLGRFTVGEAAVHHNQPVYFYFGHLMWRWAPWSVLLLAVRVRAHNAWWNLWRDPGHLWLVCWAAGGLVLLSLVPSKRVDRIFPVIPPLCLLTVAALRRAEETGSDPQAAAEGGMLPSSVPPPVSGAIAPSPPPAWPRAWSHLALRLGILLGVGGAVFGAGQAYWKRENTLARFGARVRETAAGKPFGLVAAQPKASDETLLVYLRQLEFLTPVQALQSWTTNRTDALVLSQPTLDVAAGLLGPAVPLDHPAASIPARGDQPAYILAVRAPDAPPLTVPPPRTAPPEATPHRHKPRR